MLKKFLLLTGIIVLSTSCELPFLTKADDDQEYELSHNYDERPIVYPTEILLSWSELTIDNFKEFAIERAYIDSRGHHWQTIARLTDSLAISYSDTLRDDLVFQYRLRIIDQADQFMSITSETLEVPEVTALHIPDDYISIQTAFDSPFIDSGDSLLIQPREYTDHFKFLDKDILILGVDGAELTTLVGKGRNESTVIINSGRLVGLTISGGRAYEGGGGIAATGTAIIQNCIVSFNRAMMDPTKKSYPYPMAVGGGIWATDFVQIIDCRISNNNSALGGGGVGLAGNATLIGSIITDNFDNIMGGGIFVYTGPVTIRNNIIKRNVASRGRGGGIGYYEGQHELINCIIANNVGTYGGGGIFTYDNVSLSITNCVLYGNSSWSYNGNGGATNADGSKIFLNSIVWGNTGSVDKKRLIRISKYCVIEGISPYEANGNIDSNPQFVNPAAGNFHLKSNSPCVDAGDPGIAYNDDDGSRCDIGAYGGPFGNDF